MLVSLGGCTGDRVVTSPTFKDQFPSPDPVAVQCGEHINNPDVTVDFSVILNGCPASWAGDTLWEYQYKPAGGAPGVYATYVIYYHTDGTISATGPSLSEVYPTLQIIPSGTFAVSYPSDVYGVKFRSFATTGGGAYPACSVSPPDAQACWDAHYPHDGGLAHDEVRYCIVQTTYVDHTAFCVADDIDKYAPQIARGENVAPLAAFTWRELPWECGPEICVSQGYEFDASESFDVDGSIVEYRWTFYDGSVEVTTDPVLYRQMYWPVCAPEGCDTSTLLRVTDDRGATDEVRH